MVLNLCFAVIQGSDLGDQRARLGDKRLKYAYLILPYVAFVAFFIQAYLVGKQSILVNIASSNQPPNLVPSGNLAIATILYCIIAFPSGPAGSGVPILPSGYIFSIILMVFTLLIEGIIIWQIRKRAQNRAIGSVYRPLLRRLIAFSVYRIWALGMLIGVAVKPDIILLEGILSSGSFAAYADIVQGAAPLIAFLVLSTRADVLNAWGIKRQKSSIEVVEGLDRERIFRANRYAPSIFPPKSLENGLSTVSGGAAEMEASVKDRVP